MASSEADMPACARRAEALKPPIGEPHPMNGRLQVRYLDGGDACFEPNHGGATVFASVRTGYLQECPNVARLLKNLKFDLALEKQRMDALLNARRNPRQAAKAWLQANPQVRGTWLQGCAVCFLCCAGGVEVSRDGLIATPAGRLRRALRLDATCLVLIATSPALVATHPVCGEFFLFHDRYEMTTKGPASLAPPIKRETAAPFAGSAGAPPRRGVRS
nr:glycine betaine ABC transporter substrate-binding protein [uncultured Pseudomonas sp.]